MALQKTVILSDNFDIEVSITDCYIKVTDMKGNKELMSFMVDYHKASDQGSIHQKRFTFTPSVADNSNNFIKQAYVYLKTLPEFSGSEDV
jgi:hypothetical protein